MRSFVRLMTTGIVLASAAALGQACGSSHDAITAALAAGCSLDSDCTNPLVCAFQTCHIQCNTNADCTAKSLGLCIESDKPYKVCQNPSEEDCSRNSDCPGREICAIDDHCRDACVSAKDCITGQSCVSGVCADPSSLVNGALPVGDGGLTGVPCAYATDCPGALVCILGNCTEECLGDKDCELGSVCLDTRCVPAGFTGPIPTSPVPGGGATSDGGGMMSMADGSSGGGPDGSNDGSMGGLSDGGSDGGLGAMEGGSGGSKVAIITGQNGPTEVAVHGGQIYWCNFTSSTINSASVAGTNVTILAHGTGITNTVAVDSNHVYWTNAAGTSSLSIWQANLDGSSPLNIAQSQTSPAAIAVDDANVYWINAAAGPGTGNVTMVPIGGPSTLVKVLATGLNGPIGLAAIGGNVYWSDSVDGTVNSFPRTGTAGSTPILLLAQGQNDPQGLVTDGTYVYWANGKGPDNQTTDGTIMKVAIGGAHGISTVATNQSAPKNLALDGTSVYWGTGPSAPGSILKAGLTAATSTGTLVVNDPDGVDFLTVDSTSVYWTNQQGGSTTINKVTPK